jgi:putative endonuclease
LAELPGAAGCGMMNAGLPHALSRYRAWRQRQRFEVFAFIMSKISGDTYEKRALVHLEHNGLQLVERNVRFRCGEIDLLMRDEAGVLVFVEVRARSSDRFGGAAASIVARKRERLRRAARLVLARWRGPLPPCRFDVVAFDAGRCTWLRNAFDGDGLL